MHPVQAYWNAAVDSVADKYPPPRQFVMKDCAQAGHFSKILIEFLKTVVDQKVKRKQAFCFPDGAALSPQDVNINTAHT